MARIIAVVLTLQMVICGCPAAAFSSGDTNTAAEPGITTPAKLQLVLNAKPQGAVVNLCGVAPRDCPLIPMTQTWSGGKLIFSDSPESPTNVGILYQDTNLPATGSVPNRIFVYHVNRNPSEPMKFSVLIKNNGHSAATLAVRQAGIAGPGHDYAHVGETAFYRWLTNCATATVTVRPGQTVRLDANFDSVDVANGALINGIWDYTLNQPHAIFICALAPSDGPLAVGPTLALLPRDIHGRGTFVHCDKTYETSRGTVIDTAGGIRQFPLAGDSDTYVTGCDNSVFPPIPATNNGNYGVVYTIRLNTTSANGRALALLANPQGGSWCGALDTDPGIQPGGMFVIPRHGRTISSQTVAAVAGEYYVSGRKKIQFRFMPTGASSFPVLLLTVPFSSMPPDLGARTGPQKGRN